MVTRSNSWLKSLPLIGSGCRLPSFCSLSNSVKMPSVMRSDASSWYGSLVATRSTVLLGCPFVLVSTVMVAGLGRFVQRATMLKSGRYSVETDSWIGLKWSQGTYRPVGLRSEVNSIQRGADHV